MASLLNREKGHWTLYRNSVKFLLNFYRKKTLFLTSHTITLTPIKSPSKLQVQAYLVETQSSNSPKN